MPRNGARTQSASKMIVTATADASARVETDIWRNPPAAESFARGNDVVRRDGDPTERSRVPNIRDEQRTRVPCPQRDRVVLCRRRGEEWVLEVGCRSDRRCDRCIQPWGC